VGAAADSTEAPEKAEGVPTLSDAPPLHDINGNAASTTQSVRWLIVFMVIPIQGCRNQRTTSSRLYVSFSVNLHDLPGYEQSGALLTNFLSPFFAETLANPIDWSEPLSLSLSPRTSSALEVICSASPNFWQP
jgi:hypothetical protein